MKPIVRIYADLENVWPWTPEAYPALSRLREPGEVLAFKLHHALGHLHKSVGTMEAELEKVDHGGDILSLKTDQMTELIGKSLVDLFQIAKTAGVNPDELEAWLRNFLVTQS